MARPVRSGLHTPGPHPWHARDREALAAPTLVLGLLSDGGRQDDALTVGDDVLVAPAPACRRDPTRLKTPEALQVRDLVLNALAEDGDEAIVVQQIDVQATRQRAASSG